VIPESVESASCKLALAGSPLKDWTDLKNNSVITIDRDGRKPSFVFLDPEGVLRFDYRGEPPKEAGKAHEDLQHILQLALDHYRMMGKLVSRIEVEWYPDGDAVTAHEFHDFIARGANRHNAVQTSTGSAIAALGFWNADAPNVIPPQAINDPAKIQFIRVTFWP
jgi:hypothetical protein